MNIDNLLATLNETALREHLVTHWEAALSQLPPDRPDFLRHESIRAAWEYGSHPLPLPADVLRMADRMAADPPLRHLAWYAYWRIFEAPRDKLQLPEAVTRDTCRQVSGFLLNYPRGHSGRQWPASILDLSTRLVYLYFNQLRLRRLPCH
ncbi:MAG: hypothetical protein WCI17_03620 [bacterium]